MLKKWFQGISDLLGLRPYRIYLERRSNHVRLRILKGKDPVPVSQLVGKYEQLGILEDLQIYKGFTIVPVSKLDEVKQVLSILDRKRFEVHLTEKVERLQAISIPNGFEVRYAWADEQKCCRKMMTPDGVVHLGAGWFIYQDWYWRIEKTNREDDEWLHKEEITGQGIIDLLTRKVPEWKERALPYTCTIKYTEEPLFRIQIKDVSDHTVELAVRFSAEAESAKEIPSLGNFVIVDDTIMPGLAPARAFRTVLNKTGYYRLKNEDIPLFMMSVWPKVRKWTDGEKNELRTRHKVIPGCELLLSLVREEVNGVGVVFAIPELICGDFRARAEEISKEISNHKRFVRIDPGWIPIQKLRQLGIGPLGRTVDGSSLSRILLTPAEVLNRGSNRLRGPWTRIESSELRFPEGEDVEDTARLHLEFLRTWGLPGGIIGRPERDETVFWNMFASLLQRSPETRILLVATKKDLDGFGRLWETISATRFDGNRKDPEFRASVKGVVLATPKALEATPALTSLKWDIVCLFQADLLVKSGSSRLFKSLVKCRKALTLGLFAGKDFLERTSTREALSQVFGISIHEDRLLWKYGLRNPAQQAPPAPVAFRFSRELQSGTEVTRTESESMAEFTLGDAASDSKSIPIPSRPLYEDRPTISGELKSSFEPVGLGIEISQSSGHSFSTDKFVETAKKTVNHRSPAAPHVPFMSYWPTYDSMTGPQLKWYFYWRSLVRDGSYPDTDLSYIFVLVYELINNIGVNDARDGYEQLTRIWLSYRDRHPKLDNYLVDWIFDYALINKYPADPLEIFREALKLKILPRRNDIDLLLPSYIKEPLVHLPLEIITTLSNYSIFRSKFFNDGYRSVLEECVPQSLHEVNKHLTSKFGAGIFDLFKPKSYSPIQRYPFQSALYNGGVHVIRLNDVVPYSQHDPFRDFITATVKHTENRLREANGYKGRLRGYNIEPEIQAVIDNLISSAPPETIPVSSPGPEIVIDFTRVQTLIKQSDQVLQMLQTGEGEEEQSRELDTNRHMAENETLIDSRREGRIIVRPDGTPDHLLTDLDSVNAVLTRLDKDEMHLIETLMQHDWEVETSTLGDALPGSFIELMVDRINDLSQEILGDLLIVTERKMKVVTDDFRDEIEFIFSADTCTPPGAPVAGGQEGDRNAYDELPEEWVQFRTALNAYQFEALEAILTAEDPIERLSGIAEENAVMPEFLIDSINEIALDTVGDMIVEPGSSPPAVEEEILEFARRLVQMNAK